MKEILLTQGKVALVDDDMFDELNQVKWFFGSKGYAVRSIKLGHVPKNVRMHRQILRLTDPSVQADHVNGNRLDNRRQNLRPCTHSENQRNRSTGRRRAAVSSTYKGVCQHGRGKKRWQCGIKNKGENLYLGTYADERQAADAYDAACCILHGQFARPNLLQPVFDEPVELRPELVRLAARMFATQPSLLEAYP